MRRIILLLVAFALLIAGSLTCDSNGPKCRELDQQCASCTLPYLKQTCQAAVDSGDEDSCQDGLEDEDIQSSCMKR